MKITKRQLKRIIKETLGQGGLVASNYSSDPAMDQVEDIALDVIGKGGALMQIATALKDEGFDADVSSGALMIQGTSREKFFIGKESNFEIGPEEETRQIGPYILGYMDSSMNEAEGDRLLNYWLGVGRMKITKRQLRRIIKEEKAKVLTEQKVRSIVRRQLIEQATWPQASDLLSKLSRNPNDSASLGQLEDMVRGLGSGFEVDEALDALANIEYAESEDEREEAVDYATDYVRDAFRA